jgi:hypothetical protein
LDCADTGDGKMIAFPIGAAVGNVNNHGEQLIEPIVLS